MHHLKEATKEMVGLLVSGDYAEIERRTGGVRLTRTEIQEGVEEYGRRLRMPSDETFESMSIVEVKGSFPKEWSVVCDLWTEEEGRSDLSLELTLIEEGNGVRVEVENLHVL